MNHLTFFERRAVWACVALIGSYIFCQALADVGATRLVEVWGVALPAGTFVFAATFTLRDLIHRRLGREWARASIGIAALLNLAMALYLYGASLLPAPAYYSLSEPWAQIFKFVPPIVIGSILAEVVSELVDTEVYHALRRRSPWLRVLLSNAVAQPLDSAVFAFLAFWLLPHALGGDPLPAAALPGLIVGQTVWKWLVTAISLPAIYLVGDTWADREK